MPEPTNIPVAGNDNSSMTQTPQSVQTVPLGNLGTSNIEEIPNITRKVQYAAEGNDPYSQLLSAGDTMIHRAGQDYGEGVLNPNHYDVVSGIGDMANNIKGYKDAYNHFQQVVRPRTTNEELHRQFMENLRPNGRAFNHIFPHEADDVYNEMDNYGRNLVDMPHLVGMPTDNLVREYDQLLRGTNARPERQVLDDEDNDQTMMRTQAYSLEELRRMHHELARRGMNTAAFNEHDLEGNPIEPKIRQNAIKMAQEHVSSMPGLFAERPSSFYSRLNSFKDAQGLDAAPMGRAPIEEEEEEDMPRPIHAAPVAPAGQHDVPFGVRARRAVRGAGYALADAGDAIRRGFRHAGDAVRGAFRRRPARDISSDGAEMDELVPLGWGVPDRSSSSSSSSSSGSGSGSGGDLIDLGAGVPGVGAMPPPAPAAARPAPADDMDAVLGRAGMPAAAAAPAPAPAPAPAAHGVGLAPLLAGAHEGPLYDAGHPALRRGREAEDAVRVGRGLPVPLGAWGRERRGRAYEDIETGERRSIARRAERFFGAPARRAAAAPAPLPAPAAPAPAPAPLGNIPLLPYNPPPRGVDIAAPARRYGELAHRPAPAAPAGGAAAPTLLERFRAMMTRPRQAPARPPAMPTGVVNPLLGHEIRPDDILPDGRPRVPANYYQPPADNIHNAEFRPEGMPLYPSHIAGANRAYVQPRPQEDIPERPRPTIRERLEDLWDRRPRLPRFRLPRFRLPRFRDRDLRPDDAMELALLRSSSSSDSGENVFDPAGIPPFARRDSGSGSSRGRRSSSDSLSDI